MTQLKLADSTSIVKSIDFQPVTKRGFEPKKRGKDPQKVARGKPLAEWNRVNRQYKAGGSVSSKRNDPSEVASPSEVDNPPEVDNPSKGNKGTLKGFYETFSGSIVKMAGIFAALGLAAYWVFPRLTKEDFKSPLSLVRTESKFSSPSEVKESPAPLGVREERKNLSIYQ